MALVLSILVGGFSSIDNPEKLVTFQGCSQNQIATGSQTLQNLSSSCIEMESNWQQV